MSVILFQKTSVYQELANAFEELKHLLRFRSWDDGRFYRALRRLYFANVASYLCQYHDDSPLPPEELTAIDPFVALQGKRTPTRTPVESINAFLSPWNGLKYNLITNDGEQYKACDSYEFLEDLTQSLCRAVLEQEGQHQLLSKRG